MSTSEDPPDAQRFAELWERYAARIQAYALRHVDRDSAQEVVAETFLVAWRRLALVPGEPLPWLLVVTRNTIANQHRSRRRARVLADEVARLQVVTASAQGVDSVVAERDAMLRALAELSPSDREALLLVAWAQGRADEAGRRDVHCRAVTLTRRLRARSR
ncbi:RNA polymerase sigma factor [Cellulomonas rhizosphaerae]|uniref:RNA polymerase sigma factor n=1 Tax=Cellulomonas rhizosphaerae TaxID=2293719 RepID=A0A413RLE2_9CELL|nr:RNA polymerase sigma factor [Cellulomonas rhizosphaerae]RHA40742.1 RNA polymerase sigma factor [Cellulomonas rhizosphaerae]